MIRTDNFYFYFRRFGMADVWLEKADRACLVWQNRTASVAGRDRVGRLVTLDRCGA